MENQVKNQNTCFYGGVEYSEGATICSNGSELICMSGNWSSTGKSCESKNLEPLSNLPTVQILPETENLESSFAGCEGGWSLSDGYLIVVPNVPPASAVPKFRITQNQIKITHTSSGGGKISQTLLYGSGGSFYLGSGTHNIPVGEYTDQIALGSVTGYGEIHSYICYNKFITRAGLVYSCPLLIT